MALAAVYGHLKVVKYLIPKVADLNVKKLVKLGKGSKNSFEEGNAYTALHWATSGNHINIGN